MIVVLGASGDLAKKKTVRDDTAPPPGVAPPRACDIIADFDPTVPCALRSRTDNSPPHSLTSPLPAAH